jgi:hypothetical protein
MKRVLLLVEGDAEYAFVRRTLTSYYASRDIVPIATIICTGYVGNERRFRGGVSKYSQIRKDVLRLLNDSDAAVVTTMLDLYGLPEDFPGRDSAPRGAGADKATHLETAFGNDICKRRFLPNLLVHEFEALLFAAPVAIANQLGDPSLAMQLEDVRRRVASPEDIDDSRENSPSHRLVRLHPAYEKVSDGTAIADAIGIEAIRQVCPHFGGWLNELERRLGLDSS